jgi:hypothetical protein
MRMRLALTTVALLAVTSSPAADGRTDGGTAATTAGGTAASTAGTVASTAGTVASTAGTAASTGGTAASSSGTAASSSGVFVTGKILRANGYTVLALSHAGASTSVVIGQSGAFKLKVGRDYTLQLLAPGSRYFGPIVLVHSSNRAYEALAAHGSLNLGAIKLKAAYAAPLRPVGRALVDAKIWARADRSGKPVGAGNLGLLRKKKKAKKASSAVAAASPGPCAPGGSGGPGCSPGSSGGSGNGQATGTSPGEPAPASPAPLPPGGDPTHVGIVTAFNADVTGAGVPNAENAKSAVASGSGLFTDMQMPFSGSINADASGITSAQVSEAVKSHLQLNFYLNPQFSGQSVTGVTVDCGTLPYCAEGKGPAKVREGIAPIWNNTVPASTQRPGVFQVNLAPSVGTEGIHPGDVFQLNYQTATGAITVPTTLTTYFITVPALASYEVGSGIQSVSYPVAEGAPGTHANPIMMKSGEITVSLFRPQRPTLPGESGEFVDMGHLHYGIPVRTPGASGQAGCASQFYSKLSPTLQLEAGQGSAANQRFPLHDSADDAAASPSSQVGFTLNLAGCLAADGIPATSVINLPITAVDEQRGDGGEDSAVQNVSVCLPGCDPTKSLELQGPGSGG